MIAVDAVATWRVWVTEDDLRAARTAWLQARDGGAPLDRVLDLLEELERLNRTAVFQLTGDPAGAARSGAARRVPSPSRRRVALSSGMSAAG